MIVMRVRTYSFQAVTAVDAHDEDEALARVLVPCISIVLLRHRPRPKNLKRSQRARCVPVFVSRLHVHFKKVVV
jgi:hypothetical protein